MDSFDLSFVIVNCNGKKFLSGCIDSLMRQSKPPDEIIVIDNGSTDGSLDFLSKSYPSVELVGLHKNMGLTYAYNLGLEKSKSDWVVLANNDIVLDERCLETLCGAVSNANTIATPKLVSIWYPHEAQTYPVMFAPSLKYPWSSFKLKYTDSNIYSTDITGFGVLLVNRKIVSSIDESFPLYFNEDDFSLLHRREGIDIVFVPASKVFHYGSGTVGRLSFRKIKSFAEGWIQYRVKWFSPWLLFPSTLFAIIMQFYQHLFAITGIQNWILPSARIRDTSSGLNIDRVLT